MSPPSRALPAAVFVADPSAYASVYGDGIAAQIAGKVRLVSPCLTAADLARDPGRLADVEIIFGTWGMPTLDATLLAHAPKLKVVFLGAGSVKGVASDAFWERNLTIVSAWSLNAIPVAEFALGQILIGLKHGWRYGLEIRATGRYVPKSAPMPGAYRSTVGLISLGAIGQHVARLLRAFDVQVLAYDPFCTAALAAELGVTLCPLDELFTRAHVVSVHTPSLPETNGLIQGRHLRSLPAGATFVNTARGSVVDERALIEVLADRPDLTALLDVTEPMPPAPDSPLFRLPNVVLTPHIAGAQDRECLRLGQCIAAELDRYLRGEPLQFAISRERSRRMA